MHCRARGAAGVEPATSHAQETARRCHHHQVSSTPDDKKKIIVYLCPTKINVVRRDDKIETSEHLIFLDLLRILLVEFSGHRSGPVSMVGADLLADHVIEF